MFLGRVHLGTNETVPELVGAFEHRYAAVGWTVVQVGSGYFYIERIELVARC